MCLVGDMVGDRYLALIHAAALANLLKRPVLMYDNTDEIESQGTGTMGTGTSPSCLCLFDSRCACSWIICTNQTSSRRLLQRCSSYLVGWKSSEKSLRASGMQHLLSRIHTRPSRWKLFTIFETSLSHTAVSQSNSPHIQCSVINHEIVTRFKSAVFS